MFHSSIEKDFDSKGGREKKNKKEDRRKEKEKKKRKYEIMIYMEYIVAI